MLYDSVIHVEALFPLLCPSSCHKYHQNGYTKNSYAYTVCQQLIQAGSAKHLLLIVKLLLAFVESIIRVINFRQVAPLCLINLMNSKNF